MDRREVLIGTVCATLTTDALSNARWLPDKVATVVSDEEFLSCWQITIDRALKEIDRRTALFVLGGCDCAIAEIVKLNLPIGTIAHIDDSVAGPDCARYMAECWNVSRECVNKIDNAMEFAKQAIDANDRVALLGNFSAPFSSQMLVSLATMARDVNRPVIAIGGAPKPGVQGEIRTQRGWTCIEALQRIGCCVTTVPEVDFESNPFDHLESAIESTPIGIDEGSPYCRALELALNEVEFSVASIDDDVLASTFGTGNFVSLGWGFSANGCDAKMATNMALSSGYGFSERGNDDVAMHVLVTSNSDKVLTQLKTSTEMVSDAIGAAAPIRFGASHSVRMRDDAVQITVFR